jgi:hypothetical protein
MQKRLDAELAGLRAAGIVNAEGRLSERWRGLIPEM